MRTLSIVFRSLFAWLVYTSQVPAQTAQDPNSGTTVNLNPTTTPPTSQFTWWGKKGYHYVVESTLEMGTPWTVLPSYNPPGKDNLLGMGYIAESPSNKIFFRLSRFGSDTINQFEDINSDGIPDVWQTCHFGSPTASGAGTYDDPDGDGLLNIEEFKAGTSPVNADSDNDGFGDGDDLNPLDHNFSIAMDSPYVSEFMAKTNATYPAPIGTTNSDWLEIRNPTNHSVDLTGWKLQNDNQIYTFPSGTIMAAGAYLIVLCDHPGVSPQPNVIYTDFRLQREGEYLALIQPNGRFANRFFPSYPEQTENISFGISPNGKQMGPLTTPTPGQANPGLTFVYSNSNGTLADHIAESVDSRIANKSALTDLNMFTTRNIPLVPTPQNPIELTRNPNCWASDIDLTCICLGNNYNGYYAQSSNHPDYHPDSLGINGVLITPKHILFATHRLPIDIESWKVYLMSNNNQLVERTITARAIVKTTKLWNGTPTNFDTDFTVCSINETVPNTIRCAKILQSNYLDYLNKNQFNPCVRLNLMKDIMTGEIDHNQTNFWGYISCNIPTNTKRLEFYKELEPGDSGSPGFFIINNKLVLLTTWHYGGPGGGPNIVNEIDGVNSAINTLGGGYQLSVINLNQFSSQ